MLEPLKTRWSRGETTLGAWCMAPCPLTAELLAKCGFDWVLVDMQHGGMGFETAVEMVRAIDVSNAIPIVRVPWNEPGIIGRVLDTGALGIVIPMIQGVSDAQRAVDAARYPPSGSRSFGPIRVGIRDGAGYFGSANERVAVIPMIETAKALDAVEDIARVKGVDALFVGPFDLSVALGLPPRDNDGHPSFDQALARISAAAKSAGCATAVLSNSKLAALRKSQGFQMISIITDTAALGAAAHEALRLSKNDATKDATRA